MTRSSSCVYSLLPQLSTTALTPLLTSPAQSAGQLISLLFEDLFKKFNSEIKRQADMHLAKANHAAAWDALPILTGNQSITQGLALAISSGEPVKRA